MPFRRFHLGSFTIFGIVVLALAFPAFGDDHGSGRDSGHHHHHHPPNPCAQFGLQGDNDRDHDMDDVCFAVIRQNRKFTDEDIQHLDVILEFARHNPKLRDHLVTLLADPTPGDDITPNGDGTWQITVPVQSPCQPSDNAVGCNPQATTESITTSGMSAKLSGLYRSVVFSSDRKAQLDLYTATYNHLPQGFTSPGTNLQLPTPASLTHASLTTINNALTTIGNAWQIIVPNLPFPTVPPSTANCDGEAGTDPQQSAYGDRTGDSASNVPAGLFATLSDTQFPLRQYLTCIKQQGARETCHTFAGTSAMELMISMNHGIKANLSEEDYMEHYRFLWSVGYMHETGDSYEEITDAISNNYHFAYENKWDYNPSYGRSFDKDTGVYENSCLHSPSTAPGCSDSAPQAPGICLGFQLDFLGILIPFPICSLHEAGVAGGPWKPTSVNYFWNGSDAELSKEYMILNVAFNNAVVLGFNVTPAFEQGGTTKGSGYVVYDPTDVTINKGGHYVHIVGIAGNDELPEGAPPATSGGYFIVKNSWSNGFADAGYIYLDFDYVKAVGWAGYSLTGIN